MQERIKMIDTKDKVQDRRKLKEHAIVQMRVLFTSVMSRHEQAALLTLWER